MIGFMFGFWLAGLLITALLFKPVSPDGTPLSWGECVDPLVLLCLVFWPILIASVLVLRFGKEPDDDDPFYDCFA